MKHPIARIARVALCLLLLGTLGIILAPQPARAVDLPWETEFLNLDNYRNWQIRPTTTSVNNSDWRVQLSNASCAVPIHVDASTFVGEHDLYASVELCTTADFEIEFKKANWHNSTVGTDITKNYRLYSMEIFDTSSLNQLVGYIPFVGNLAGVTFNKKIVGAATAPCVVKGKFSVKAVYKVGYDDDDPVDVNRLARADYEANFQITSIDPKGNGRDEDVTVFVGDYETLDSGFGKVSFGVHDFDVVELGPLITGKAGIFAGNVVTFRVEHDQLDSTYSHQPRNPNLDVLHTCCENGKEGCLTGRSRIIQQRWYEWKSHVRAVMMDYELFDFNWDWGGDEDYIKSDVFPVRQSLTWGEPLKYTDECPHRVYRVPVGVWANEAKTMPVNGMTVKPAENVQVDPNVEKYTHDVSGTDERGAGLATLYLPYKDGKYTIEASGKGLSGSAEQPSDMVKAKNDQVDIIVRSNETRTLSVRKEWDIDYEDKDRPESIEVLLQAQYYSHGKNIWSRTYNTIKSVSSWEPVQLITLNAANNWQATFEPVSRWEIIDDSGPIPVMKEIRYRIRELKPDSSGAGDVIGAVFDADDNGRILPLDGDDEDWPEPEIYEQDDAIIAPVEGQNADQARLKKAGGRVVHWRWDLDNTKVYGTIKDRLTNWDKYWQIDLDYQSYLKGLAKDAFFPMPTVTYEVPAYTSSVGERVEEHDTKYVVDYSNEGDTTVIKNTAVMDVAIYKRWLNFSEEEETPESVWLILQSRVKEKYLALAGAAGDRVPYTPVLYPLYGNITNLAGLLGEIIPGADLVAKLDVEGLLDISVAVGKAKQKTNPLISYRLKFGVKKYNVAKLPQDFEAGEITSEVLKDALKVITGLDIPISISLTGDGYVTFPGKAFNLFKDWELTSNVINVKADLPDGDDDPTIAGVKTWKGEGWQIGSEEGDRLPEYIDIVVRDGETEVGRVRVNKADQTEGSDAWAWKLSQSDIDAANAPTDGGSQGAGGGETNPADASGGSDQGTTDGVQLDPNKTYTITEEFPEDYEYRNSFVASIDGHNITNTWAPSATLVIEKQYEGGEEEPVTVRLINDKGEAVGDYPLNAENGFRVMLKNKPADSEDGEQTGEEDAYTVALTGHDISAFRVEETEVPEKFTPAYSGPSESVGENGEAVYTFTVTNRAQRNITVHVEKTWKGDRQADRPDGVEVTLKRNGAEVASATLNATGNWQAEFTQDGEGNPLVALDENGAEYSYTLEEEALENYSAKVEHEASEGAEGDVIHTFRLTNTWTGGSDKVTVSGGKTWLDNNNAAQARPESIAIHVMADGHSVKDLEVTEASGWAWTVGSLPRYDEDGGEIRYTVYEDEVEGYTTRYGEPTFDEAARTWICDVTNAYTEDSIDITVTKVWVDVGFDQSRRPGSVEVKLYGQVGEAKREMASASLTEAGGWAHTFTGLKREERPGVPITYTVEETPVPNYDTEVTGSAEEGFTITNTRDDNMFSIRVAKVWEDNDNHDGMRPISITVHITRDGEVFLNGKLSEENGWSCTFEGLPYYRDKDKKWLGYYNYDVTEDDIPGYEYKTRSITETGSMDVTFTFTNQQKSDVQTGNIDVEKDWVGDHDNVDKRPTSLTVTLMYGDAEVRQLTMTAADAQQNNPDVWISAFENVPLYLNDGTLVPYRVREEKPGDYKAVFLTIPAGDTIRFMLKNSYNPVKPKFEVTKVWDDDDSVERPASVAVKLMSGGEVVQTAVLTQVEGWKHTFTDLDPGKEYTVEEETPAGYVGEVSEVTEAVIDGVTTYRATITNRLNKQVKASFTVRKEWRNADDTPMEAWPEGKTVTSVLLRAGQEIDRTVLTADAPEHTFEGLRAFDERGSAIAYSAVEFDVDGFVQLPKALASQRQTDGSIAYHCTFVNRAESPTIDIPVEKVWEDDTDEAGNISPNRPDHVTVHLYADGVEVEGSPAEVTGVRNWKYTFKDLPKYQHGKEVEYTITESRVENYGNPVITGTADEGFTVRNEWLGNHRDITVTKNWVEPDADYRRSFRPESVTVYLTVNGEVTDYSLTISGDRSADTWTGTISRDDLPRNVVFDSIVEAPVPGYRASYSGFTVTNTANTVRYTVKKVWKDADGSVMDTAESATVNAKSDGKDVGIASLTRSNGYTATLELPYLDENGDEIKYTFVEDPVPSKYTVSYEKQADTAFDPRTQFYTKAAYIVTVTNTQDRTSFSVRKRWDDGNDALGWRPESVTVRLTREDGGALPDGVTTEATLNEANQWSHYFRSLPRYDDSGAKIAYTVEEDPVPGYSAAVTRQSDGTIEIVNRLTLDVRVDKNWKGDGKLPETLYAFLYADGALQDECLLTGVNGWTYTFRDLPAINDDGTPIQYMVREDALDGFHCEMRVAAPEPTQDGRMELAVTLTNTPYDAVTVEVPVRKVVKGNPPSQEIFTFRLGAEAEDAQSSTLEITGEGTESFSLSFDRKGYYFYTLSEIAGSTPGYSYDLKAYLLQVNVSEDANGRLKATWTLDGKSSEAAVFTNRYDDVVTPTPGGNTPTPTPGGNTPTPTPGGNTPTPTPGGNTPTPTPEVTVTPTPTPEVTVTPTPTPELAELTVFKVWDETDMPTPPPTPEPTPVPEAQGDEAEPDDTDAEDGDETEEDEFEWPKRPESVTVHVYNGTKHMGETVLNAENRWQHTFTDLPFTDEGGNVIPYTVTEDFAEGYDTTVGPVEHMVDMQGNVYHCTVTNTWTGNKTDVPTVTKKVKERNDVAGLETDWQDAADYDIGDSIPFRLIGTLPTRFEKFEQFTVYTFTDTLPDGLTLDERSVSVTKNGTVDLSDRFDVVVSGQQFTVRLKAGQDMRLWEGEQALTNKDRIVVEYTATLNSSAVVGPEGNPNAVTLTYTTESDGEYDMDTTPEDKVTVFTYTIEAHKVDGERQPLEGAGFTLFKSVEGEWVQIGDEVVYTAAGADGAEAADGDATAEEGDAEGNDTAAEGDDSNDVSTGKTTFTFVGVDAGTYKLVETTVPAGYNRVKDLEITVIAYYDTEAIDPKLNILSVSPTDAGFAASLATGVVSGDIVNTRGLHLPGTGGRGTRGIYITGAALLLAATLLLGRRRRDRA